jgi:hypothetical protein
MIFEWGMTISTVVRERPDAQFEFLRHQIGCTEMRYEQVPVFDGRKFMGCYRRSDNKAPVFRLLGFGSTKAKAKAMARETEKKMECAEKNSC